MSKLEEYGLEVSFSVFRNTVTHEESHILKFDYSSSSFNRPFLDELTLLLWALPFSSFDYFVKYLEDLRDRDTVNSGYIEEVVCPIEVFYTMNYVSDSKMLSIDYTGGPTLIPVQDLIDILKELKVLMEQYQ